MSALRRARPWIFAVATLLGVLIGRALFEGRAAVRRCDELAAKGDIEGAIAYGMRAAKWYVPLSTHPRDGYDRLRAIAVKAELGGDSETALIAWQAIRAAARGTQSLWQPYPDRLQEADEHIAVLLASKPPPGIDKDKPREQILAEHRALLARNEMPRVPAIVALYLGLALWLWGAWRLTAVVDAWASDRSEGDRWGEGRARRALTGGIAAVVGVVTFLLALARA